MGTVEYKEALYKAKRALQKYYTENNLNPAKDYSKDPIHGDMVTNLILRLNKERDKLERRYPILKIKSNLKRLRIMAKKAKEAKASKKEKKAAIAEVENKKTKKTSKKEAPKEKKEKTRRPTKYDYPLIDGREMNSLEKKQYRMEQRKLKEKTSKDTSESKKDHKEKTSKKPVTKEVSKEKKDLKKKKKVKKEED